MKYRTGSDRSITRGWARQTQMVRAGSMRSNFDEMSEALFLTSGFAYENAEEAEARFDGRQKVSPIRARPTRQLPCSRSAWPCLRALTSGAPPGPAWRP